MIASKKIINRAVSTSRRFTKLKAYNKTGRICSRCSNKIVKLKVRQRTAHFCPNCQMKKWFIRLINKKIFKIKYNQLLFYNKLLKYKNLFSFNKFYHTS